MKGKREESLLLIDKSQLWTLRGPRERKKQSGDINREAVCSVDSLIIMYAIPSHPLQSNWRHTFPSESQPTTRSHPYLNLEFPRRRSGFRDYYMTTVRHSTPLPWSFCPWNILPLPFFRGYLKLFLTVALEIMISCTCSCRKAATGDTQTRGGWLFAHATAAAAAVEQLPYLLSLVLILAPIFNSAVLW